MHVSIWLGVALVAVLVVAASLTLSLRRASVPGTSGSGPVPPASVPLDAETMLNSIGAGIAERGWTCIDVDDASPAFAYTVGLSAKKLPELLLIWDGEKTARCGLVNAVAEILDKRAVEIPDHFEPLGPGKVRLNRVYDDEFFAHCPLASVWASMHGVRDVIGVQIVFAEEDGSYPG